MKRGKEERHWERKKETTEESCECEK